MVLIWRFKNIYIASLTLFLISGCGSGGSDSGAGSDSDSGVGTGVTLARNYTNSFARATFHPRCRNCHTFREGNAISARHRAQNRSNRCSNCHTQDNWRAPMQNMTTTGKSASEVCLTAVNRRGSTDAVAELLKTSPHVRWAIEDGSLPNGQRVALAPPGDHILWTEMVDDWVAAGASCE